MSIKTIGTKEMEGKIVYFDRPGTENTEAVLHIARQRAEELGIETILVASSGGDSAVQATEVFSGFKVIAVSHVTSFRDPDTQEFTDENRNIFESKGGTVLTTTHAFGGISRAIRNKHNMYLLGDIVADVLRIFGEGMKVACEITLMAADGGLVRTDKDVIAIAGTGRGADTAILLAPICTHNF
jgi:hypothetical protein